MNSIVTALRKTWPELQLPAMPPPMITLGRRVRLLLDRHRKAVAVGGSLLLHLVFLSAILFHLNGTLAGGGAGGLSNGPGAYAGNSYNVDLYAAQHPAAVAQVKPQDEDEVSALTPLAEIAPAASVQVLAQATEVPQLGQTEQSAAGGGIGHGGTTAGENADLWAAIAPCWNRIADKATLPVALEVTFSSDGHLAKPPVIDRDYAASITTQSLQSEAKAISALAQCGAYAMAAGKTDLKVQFPKPE